MHKYSAEIHKGSERDASEIFARKNTMHLAGGQDQIVENTGWKFYIRGFKMEVQKWVFKMEVL